MAKGAFRALESFWRDVKAMPAALKRPVALAATHTLDNTHYIVLRFALAK
jgi:hypothetical protein